jgi:tripartite-type tricarboxylate transporter receptor subunit TctC
VKSRNDTGMRDANLFMRDANALRRPAPLAAPMMRAASRALVRTIAASIALAAADFVSTDARTQPLRTTKFIVGFGAGGPTDIVARVLADRLADDPGWKIVVENRTGASGNMATQAVAAAPADGSTFLIGASPLAVNHALFPELPVRFGRDLVAVAPIGATANVLVVHPSLNVRDLAGFVHFVRQNPGTVSYATVGKGSSSDLAGAAFDARAGTRMIAVNYRGGGDAAKDLLGGHVQAWFATAPSVLDAIRSGQLVAIATTGPERMSWLPDVPTIAEAGFPGFDVRLWIGVFAPAGVAEETLRAIEQAIARAMASPAMRTALDNQGIAPFPMGRAEFGAYVQSEIERWTAVLGAAKSSN